MNKKCKMYIGLVESVKDEPLEAQTMDAVFALHKRGLIVNPSDYTDSIGAPIIGSPYKFVRDAYAAAPVTRYGKTIASLFTEPIAI